MTNTDYTLKGEITNGCACLEWEDGAGYDNEVPAEHCTGTCWDDQVEDFTECLYEYVQANPTGIFHIEDFPLWYGTTSGWFEARTAADFLSSITIRGDWTLRWELAGDAFTATIGHHDGSGTFTVVYAADDAG